MKRKHAPQIMTQKWFPAFLRTLICEFLDWFVLKVNATRPFVPVIRQGLEHARKQRFVVLQQSIGAGFNTVLPVLEEKLEFEFVAPDAFKANQDALYISVNSFHQYRPDQARLLLSEIATQKQAVLILEGNNNNLWQIIGMTIFVPLTVLFTGPFVRPFRFSRLIFTYLIPVLPLIIMLDGCLALLKLYAPEDLDELCSSIEVSDYTWESGKKDNNRGGKIIYLLGYPGN